MAALSGHTRSRLQNGIAVVTSARPEAGKGMLHSTEACRQQSSLGVMHGPQPAAAYLPECPGNKAPS